MKRIFSYLVLSVAFGMAQDYDYSNMGLVSNPQYYYTSDVWGYTDENGHDFAVFGVYNGTVILDVSTNPSQPVETGYIEGAQSTWRDLKTHDDYLYVTNESGGGLDIIDMSDPWHPFLAGQYQGFGSAHNLFIADGFAYIVGSNLGGILILDLADPVNPVEVGSWDIAYIHDIYVQSDTAYACGIYTGDLFILDVSDKSDIQEIYVLDYDQYGCHAVWVTDDSNFIITSDETTGGHVKIWDATDYSNINLASEYEMGQGKSVHNVLVRGDKLFISYYVFGTRVLDISDPYNPVEVAYFDNYPGDQGLYAGNWGTYPFTNSGLVYSTSMSGDGFFILQYPLFVEFDHEPLTDMEDMAGPYTVEINIVAGEGNEIVEETAVVISGLNGVFTDTTMLIPGYPPEESYSGVIPGPGEAGVFHYYFAVEDTAGRWSTEPYGAPESSYSFNVGPDQIPPEILSMTNLENTVYYDGSQEITCQANDNIGIFEVRFIWSKNGGPADSLLLTETSVPDEYAGTFEWGGTETGDIVEYYVRVVDDTQNQNVTDSEMMTFEIVPNMTIGNFDEFDLSNWDTGDSWGTLFINNDVEYGINDSPGGPYEPNSDNALTLIESLDLSQFESAWIGFWTLLVLQDNADFGYVEVSTNGTDWEIVRTVTGEFIVEELFTVELTDYIGQEEVYLRFRVVSDDDVEMLGWYLDDIEFYVNSTPPTTSIDPFENSLPDEYKLMENYPNPFNPITTIQFNVLETKSIVSLQIYDVTGRLVESLVNERLEPGTHSVIWDASEYTSGAYFYKIEVRSDGVLRFSGSRKMVLIK